MWKEESYFILLSQHIFGPENVICLLHLLHIFKCTSEFRLDFFMEANNMDPDLDLPLNMF